MEEIDLSSLERAEPRLLTQRAGRIAFELGFAGIFYHSRYGHSIENWAIFDDWTMSERFPLHQPRSRKITPSTQADVLSEFLDRLRIETIDLVANDTGGEVAQLTIPDECSIGDLAPAGIAAKKPAGGICSRTSAKGREPLMSSRATGPAQRRARMQHIARMPLQPLPRAAKSAKKRRKLSPRRVARGSRRQ